MAASAAALAIAGSAVLGLAAPASAHNYLVSATPAADSTLTELPESFAITTNDRLLDIGDTDSGFAFRVVGPDGEYFEDGCVDVDGPTMTTAAALGDSGEYTVEWQIISADGHTVSDSYDFTWDAPAGFSPRSGLHGTADVCRGRGRVVSGREHDGHRVRHDVVHRVRRPVDRRGRPRRRGCGGRRAPARPSSPGACRRRPRRGLTRTTPDTTTAPYRSGTGPSSCRAT
ncbi:copper resistance CopC family protein [Curtobacterium sp. MCJR17_043]|uniref:copper resistance CopC family protein n=1 Tax=Curtobacterium sp. MCJR17_043 TaxID=2175660 RepID=UPI0024DFF2A8|nr:copper resistance CopC family protein [Curtobacterium sp. MCJR17_043]WIB36835.1 copper resistance protein CopC [Curtobacterium sp. MCJR17_043]